MCSVVGRKGMCDPRREELDCAFRNKGKRWRMTESLTASLLLVLCVGCVGFIVAECAAQE